MNAPMHAAPDDTLLSCRIADPVDGLCRILMLLSRCGVAVRAIEVSEQDGAWRAQLRLGGPLPYTRNHLCDRLRAMPGLLAAAAAGA